MGLKIIMMQRSIFLSIILFNIVSYTIAQSDPGKYDIHLNNNQQRYSGYIYEFRDTSLLFVEGWIGVAEKNIYEIPASKIFTIKKNVNKRLKGMCTYGALGFVLGATIGFAQGDDQCKPGQFCILLLSKEDKAIGIGVLMGLVGGITGIIKGKEGKSYPIHYYLENFTKQKKKLIKYQILH